MVVRACNLSTQEDEAERPSWASLGYMLRHCIKKEKFIFWSILDLSFSA
jgi:hypothetical protein